jgi:hypothetical protein
MEDCKRWKPQNNEQYYYIDSFHTFSMLVPVVHCWTWDEKIPINQLRWNVGNCFKEKEKAEERVLKLRNVLID